MHNWDEEAMPTLVSDQSGVLPVCPNGTELVKYSVVSISEQDVISEQGGAKIFFST